MLLSATLVVMDQKIDFPLLLVHVIIVIEITLIMVPRVVQFVIMHVLLVILIMALVLVVMWDIIMLPMDQHILNL
jgi:hypothetical protein